MSGFSTHSYLVETLVWTAVLIAAVLMLRRPVSRYFGPHIAYGLWSLPFLRLILPPLELPSWMQMEWFRIADAGLPVENTIFDPVTPVATTSGSAVIEAAASGGADTFTPWAGLESSTLIEIGLALWLIGAAVFLVLRYAAYFRLREELLRNAVELGRHGNIRLFETPDTDAPLAFGVLDKIIALPQGFLAHHDRAARDLALSHEIAHHKGRDLLVNVLVQPLFALHWWNPLSHYGWLALRRDQELSCDARVLASQPVETRQIYAKLIADFAAGVNPAINLSMAAPMACPVLGEKSIIQRLKCLNRDDMSDRRRLAGRLMVGTAALALPMTATISYAASEEIEPPLPPFAPEAPAPVEAVLPAGLVPPVPPAPPASPNAPEAPPAPDAPTPVADLHTETLREFIIDEDNEVFVVTHKVSNRAPLGRNVRAQGRAVVQDANGFVSEESIQQIMVEVQSSLREANVTLENLPVVIERVAGSQGLHHVAVSVKTDCNGRNGQIVQSFTSRNGRHDLVICQSNASAHANSASSSRAYSRSHTLAGLKEARNSLLREREEFRSAEKELPASTRAMVLRSLDQQIAAFDRQIKSLKQQNRGV